MLAYVISHDDSRIVPEKGERGRESAADTRSNTFRNPSRHLSRSLLICIKRRQSVVCDFPFGWRYRFINNEPDQYGAAEVFERIFTYYWSQICCVIDVQYKQQQLEEWTEETASRWRVSGAPERRGEADTERPHPVTNLGLVMRTDRLPLREEPRRRGRLGLTSSSQSSRKSRHSLWCYNQPQAFPPEPECVQVWTRRVGGSRVEKTFQTRG